MSQAGFTPIQLYYSTTASAAPSAGNLANGELAMNITDGKLYYKDNGGSVQVLASKAGNINVASFQTSLGGLTPSTATTGIVTLAGTLNTTSGGTGLTSFTAGDLPYYAAGTLLSKLSIGTTGQILTSSGTAPQWSTLSGVAVTTFSAGTTGFTPSSATSGAITLSGTLATTNGGTGLTSFTANGVVYASSTSALATGSALTFDGSTLVSSSGVRANSFMEIRNNSATLYWENAANTLYWAQKLTGSDFAWDYYNGSGVSEQMRLTSTGLGIGTSSPDQKLTIVGNQKITGYIELRSANRIYFDDSGNTASGSIWNAGTGAALSFSGAGTSEQMRLDSAGIVTMSAYGAGAATFSAAGVISSVSDETWKTKDGVPTDPDAMLKKLEPGYWYYNDEKKEIFGSDRQLGFYAQNVNASIGPEAAPTPEAGKPWGYYDRSVLAITVMSLQKALATIETLTARVAQLESK